MHRRHWRQPRPFSCVGVMLRLVGPDRVAPSKGTAGKPCTPTWREGRHANQDPSRFAGRLVELALRLENATMRNLARVSLPPYGPNQHENHAMRRARFGSSAQAA